ncbi:GDP dissociation inhibitor [Geosmithia morbida]|uniref:Rab proteins geranylgeranyltransferase n=1 Tax=Geosmithia morbida TaxID=1094350 RepID=A0A9P4YZ70_9HYPO|nr:GDP dissociation inhibitor [Geosmithia morbida]KAF4124477.1 GDP dissociation inhibitor [Geosmithia morbida]
MESLADTKWDVVISGTGLQQSLLALALSRSGKNILHIDPNDFYGDAEAALGLQDVDEWVPKNSAATPVPGSGFAAAEVERMDAVGDSPSLSASRAYSIALAPQLIHTKSKLLSQLVSSKAFRQVEFLAVGSFYILQPAESGPSLNRVPSTREDVFSSTAIPARAKRSLMKFLKFALDYESETNSESWKSRADEQLDTFLASDFKLDDRLRADIMSLTLTPDGLVSVRDGLAAINRHMTSMGLFGGGFAAVYPKWGGLSEVAQVGCRAGAVGGAVYMLGTGLREVKRTEDGAETPLTVALSNGMTVNAQSLVQCPQGGDAGGGGLHLRRLTAIVGSSLSPLFETVVEGAPTPAVAVVAVPAGSVAGDSGVTSRYPIYAMAHSSDTGECPSGQCVIYLSTVSTPASKDVLDKALSSLLEAAVPSGQKPPPCLYKLSYEQTATTDRTNVDDDGPIVNIPPLPLDLSFNDGVMDCVQKAWESVKADDDTHVSEYMKFDDREGAEDNDFYD